MKRFAKTTIGVVALLASLGVPAVVLAGVFGSTRTNAVEQPVVYGTTEVAPSLGREAVPARSSDTFMDQVRARRQLTPTARVETYSDVQLDPLIAEATEILSRRLAPYAKHGVFVTSLLRAYEDQRRLLSKREYRWWAIPRSKHLMGLAADLGFTKRTVSMWKMRGLAERILDDEMGERAKYIRVVRESKCLHIEIDTHHGREIIEQRRQEMQNLGVVANVDRRYPVPPLSDYFPERLWERRPTFVAAVAQ